jgi:hypothetical protein
MAQHAQPGGSGAAFQRMAGFRLAALAGAGVKKAMLLRSGLVGWSSDLTLWTGATIFRRSRNERLQLR